MASNVTLKYLEEQVREAADMVNSRFVTPTFVRARINAHAKSLRDKLILKGIDYFLIDSSLTLDGSSDGADLPADFYMAAGVDRQVGSKWEPLEPFIFAERDLACDPERPRFRILDPGRIRFYPKPRAQTFLLWYAKPFADLVAPTDTLDGFNGWEDFIIYSAAIDCLVKEESDTSGVEKQLKSVSDRIDALASRRSSGPARVADVRGYG